MTRDAAAPGRLAAWRRGRRGEWRAAWRLRLGGYRILARNLRTPMGEIDILARRGSILAVVEVKTRASEAAARAALTPAQQRRLTAAALWALARLTGTNPPDKQTDISLRFDVMLVTPFGWPRHLAGAWRADDGRSLSRANW